MQSLKAEIQFLENYTGDFQITFKKGLCKKLLFWIQKAFILKH
jgi:hypothetical protein